MKYETKLPMLNSDWGKKEFKSFERTIESIKSPEKEVLSCLKRGKRFFFFDVLGKSFLSTDSCKLNWF